MKLSILCYNNSGDTMIYDIIIILIMSLSIFYGFKKGFVIQLVNLIFFFAYFSIANLFLDSFFYVVDNYEIKSQIESNGTLKYILLVVIGLVLMLLLNIILRRLFRLKILSFINRVGGLVIAILLCYFLISIINWFVLSTNDILYYDQGLKDSFFLGLGFKDYNFLFGW